VFKVSIFLYLLFCNSEIVNDYLQKRAFSSQLRSAYPASKSTHFGRVMASSGSEAKANYAPISTNEPVVSVDWLHSNLGDADIKVLDASWYMAHEQRNPIQEYQGHYTTEC